MKRTRGRSGTQGRVTLEASANSADHTVPPAPSILDGFHQVTDTLDAMLAKSRATRRQVAASMADAKRRDRPASSSARTPTDD